MWRHRRWRRELFTGPGLSPTFDKVLIANRGEIACRVARTARLLGVRTVGVYSDADRDSLHVRQCDEAYRIGEAPAAESYLRADRILAVAKQAGAQAVHPGYGFLSESVKFAEACDKEGIEFIGPPVKAIDAMGSKSAAKKIMIEAGVPVVPGYHGADQSISKLTEEAGKTGFPLMIKAVLGGGGKGMRIVWKADDFQEALEACMREAQSSFGDSRVLLERYIVRPRHIEFQIFADKHGNAVHLFERDCSAQRRHQKVLEEGPAPGMTDELRRQMGASAVQAALSVGYVGAGTVEFIFDSDTNEYYFMEMNTRLQVEHPVTEMIVRIPKIQGSCDLVQLQLHVAAGHPLPFKQEDVVHEGHCIEARIYAESPVMTPSGPVFLPCTGTIEHLQAPDPLDGSCVKVRVETGIEQGSAISVYYDPMIAKLVVWSRDRRSALLHMGDALAQYQILGLANNNIAFLHRAVSHPVFAEGQITTNFIAENQNDLMPSFSPPRGQQLAMAAAAALYDQRSAHRDPSPWANQSGFRVNSSNGRQLSLLVGHDDDWTEKQIDAVYNDDGSLTMKFDDEVHSSVGVNVGGGTQGKPWQFSFQDRTLQASVVYLGNDITIFCQGHSATVRLPDVVHSGVAASQAGSQAPMPGKIVKVLVSDGDTVAEGDALIVMEAMKMEHVIRAPHSGTVDKVLCELGQFVQGGAVLVSFQDDGSA
ncbi:unnamed protein product (mitochondrion) [Plasmodiophora brassicae]|uniref:Methylcrotonoyl-CoA carboxylase n=1 Tax=Plasmodiophora brassicae TaxID=37360 RepID=A0A0G4IJI9_PLABS|nr:hypothetical protein PBRA_004011 [Plasmodiophora brassicae]SPQ96303.1 unnamed protein product [Plasmodiophora brassicae]